MALPRTKELQEAQVNDFAIRCFRDIADGDYISARMAFRAQLLTQCLWASQQAIEKYLKCILLLNRIPARDIGHDLGKALARLTSAKLALDLQGRSTAFIQHLDPIGRFRYQEVSNYTFGRNLLALDQAVWELRRFCTRSEAPRRILLRNGIVAPRVRLNGGILENIIDNPEDPAREPLLWQNGFFGRRIRRKMRMRSWMKAVNAPLYLHPEILDEVLRYVKLGKEVESAYREHAKRVGT